MDRSDVHCWEGCQKSVIVICIRDIPVRVRQQPNAAVAIVTVEADATGLILTDEIEAVGVGALHSTADDFLDDLHVAGEITVIDGISGGYTTDSLRHAIAVAVVDDDHTGAILLGQVILEVIVISLAIRASGVAVVIVGVAS